MAKRARHGKKGRRRGEDEDDGKVCGMSRSTAFLVLSLLMISTPCIIFLEQILTYFMV